MDSNKHKIRRTEMIKNYFSCFESKLRKKGTSSLKTAKNFPRKKIFVKDMFPTLTGIWFFLENARLAERDWNFGLPWMGTTIR